MARRIVLLGLLFGAAILFALLFTTKAQASDCTVEAFSVSPSSSSQAVGTILSLYGRGNCAGGIRASRFNIDGGGFGEDAGAPEQNETWALPAGSHTICFEIAGGSNGDWSAGARSCTTVTGTTVNPPNPTTCSIEFFNATPSSPVVLGTEVALHGRGNCGTSRFEINGQPRAEIGAPEQTETWRTAEFGVGTYDVCYVLRGDGGWENADRDCKTYVVASTAQPPTPTPPPTPGVCQVNRFTVSPGGGTPGTVFTFSGSGSCNIGVRAVRFLIDGSPFGEIGAPSQTVTWNSSGYPEGNHVISFQVVAGDWGQAATSSVTLVLSSSASATDPISGNVTTNIPNVPVESISTTEVWAGYDSPPNGNHIRVNVAYLNLRYGPSTAYPEIAQVAYQAFYPLLELQGNWARIATQVREGWVYIGEGFATVFRTGFLASNDVSIQALNPYEVNVRSGPSIYSGTIGSIFTDEEYRVIGKNANSKWAQIEFNGQLGWVCRDFTTDNGLMFLVPVTDPRDEDCYGHSATVGPDDDGLQRTSRCLTGLSPRQEPTQSTLLDPNYVVEYSGVNLRDQAETGQVYIYFMDTLVYLNYHGWFEGDGGNRWGVPTRWQDILELPWTDASNWRLEFIWVGTTCPAGTTQLR